MTGTAATIAAALAATSEVDALFREMVNGLPLIVWVHDADGQQVMVNDTFCEFFGVTREEMKGGRWKMLTHPDDTAAYTDAFLAATRERRPFHAEVRARRADGAWRWMESWARPRFDASGAFRGFIGTSADITEKKRAESELVRALTLIEGITEGTEDLIAAMDPELRFTYFNAPYAREFARLWSQELEVGASMVEALAAWPDELRKAEGLWRRALGGESFRVEMAFGPTPEAMRTYDLRFSPLRDAEGRVTGAAHIFRDVTEQVRMRQAVRDSEERAQAIITSIADGLMTLDTAWRVTMINPRGREMAGPLLAGQPDVVGRVFWEAFPDTRGTVIEDQFRHAMATRAPLVFEVYFEPLAGWFDVRVYPARDGGLSVYFLDSTDRKRTEEQLRESDRRKDEYLAMLGHELRNPLAAIQNAAELVKLTAADEPRIARAIGVLERQSTHMARLIEGLLEVSRIARGKIALERASIDLREVVADVLEDRGAELAARRLELVRALPAPVWVNADRVRIAQVIDNLVGNALKFTPPAGRITLALDAVGEHATLRIRDTGVGVSPEKLSEIFEPFHQEAQDVARGSGGLGLGLALAKGLVELHGGMIAAHSAGPGTGLEIEVRLPRAEPAAVRTAPDAPTAAACRRILIVEDNPDAAQMLCDVLCAQGHDVAVAATGPEALAELHSAARDLVLCDIGLPGMNGYELARAVRADADLRDTVLVAVTGYGQPEDRERSVRAGFDGHLTKPVSLGALGAALAIVERR